MDPYAIFKCREFDWKSNTVEKGSTHPKWDSQMFDLDVKYMGDDLYYYFYDDDPGKDEKIVDGCSKISTFCAEPHIDMWHKLEWKGKEKGSVRLITHWQPNEVEPTKEEHEDEMAKAQEIIKKLSERKNELTAEWEGVHADTEKHEAEYEEWRAALEICDCGAKYDEAVAAEEERFGGETERIEKERAIANEAKEDFEKKMAEKISEAAAARDA